MTTTTLQKVESRDEIEAGDKITIIGSGEFNDGEVIADSVEVSNVREEGFAGLLEVKTDGEIDATGTLDSKLEQCDGFPDAQGDMVAYKVIETDGVDTDDDGEQRKDADAAVVDGTPVREGECLTGPDGDTVTVDNIVAWVIDDKMDALVQYDDPVSGEGCSPFAGSITERIDSGDIIRQ